jgi:16S rRNA (uracil1498-N3)-methyltransferase
LRITRLFTDQPLSSGKQVVLEGKVAQHLGRVLRAKEGDVVALFNGNGEEYVATVTEISKRAVCVVVGEAATPATESRVHTLLGLCLSKGDRFDWAVQKATELGVGAIVPLYSERVDFSIPEDRIAKRVQHWQKVAISASEQCGRVRVPSVAAPTSLANWTEAVSADEKWVLHCADVAGNRRASRNAETPGSAALLIGPEGGLTEGEISTATDHGFIPLQLGPRVLRTETAPVVALTALSMQWGEMLS